MQRDAALLSDGQAGVQARDQEAGKAVPEGTPTGSGQRVRAAWNNAAEEGGMVPRQYQRKGDLEKAGARRPRVRDGKRGVTIRAGRRHGMATGGSNK